MTYDGGSVPPSYVKPSSSVYGRPAGSTGCINLRAQDYRRSKPELCGSFNEDGDVVPHAALSKKAMFVGNDILDDGAWLIREAPGQLAHHSPQSPDFSFPENLYVPDRRMVESYECGPERKGKCYGLDRPSRTAAPPPCCCLEAVAIPAHGPDKEDGRTGHDHRPDTLQTRRVIGAAEHKDGDAQRHDEE